MKQLADFQTQHTSTFLVHFDAQLDVCTAYSHVAKEQNSETNIPSCSLHILGGLGFKSHAGRFCFSHQVVYTGVEILNHTKALQLNLILDFPCMNSGCICYIIFIHTCILLLPVNYLKRNKCNQVNSQVH